MPDVKELAKWLEEEVEFLKNNEDYVGGWYLLPNGLAATILWEDGWGDEVRDDAIQSAKNPDWALCAGILVYNPSDTPDGWFMPWDSKTGDIICETTGITPNEDYDNLAKWLLQDFNLVKDCEIKSNGEVIGYDAQFEQEASKEDEVKDVEVEKETEVKDESLKEEVSDKEVSYWKDAVILMMESEAYEEYTESMSSLDENDMATRIAEKIVVDDDVWEQIDNAICWYIEEELEKLGLYESKKSCNESKDESLKEDNTRTRDDLKQEIETELHNNGLTSDVKLKAERCGFKIVDDKVIEDDDIKAKADAVTRHDSQKNLGESHNDKFKRNLLQALEHKDMQVSDKDINKFLSLNSEEDFDDWNYATFSLFASDVCQEGFWDAVRLWDLHYPNEDRGLKESKKLHEDKEFHSSPYHDIIAEYFEYDSDFEFLDVVANILGRVDNFEDDEDIYQAIDDELIYTYDQWTVLEHYCTPQDANWEVAWESLSGDIFGVCATIAEANKMSGEESEEENDDE